MKAEAKQEVLRELDEVCAKLTSIGRRLVAESMRRQEGVDVPAYRRIRSLTATSVVLHTHLERLRSTLEEEL